MPWAVFFAGGGDFVFLKIIREKTIKHKYQYFHINQRNSKNISLPGARRRGGQNLYFTGPTNLNINFLINQRN